MELKLFYEGRVQNGVGEMVWEIIADQYCTKDLV